MKKLLILLTLFFCFIGCNKKQKDVFTSISVDKEKRSITFNAQVNLTCKEKYFLFYFEGYPWIKDHCLFISSASLKELQTAVAYIDWHLWDKIYTKNFSPKIKIEIFDTTANKWVNFDEFLSIKNFDTYQTVFWGSYLFDKIVLERNYKTSVCNSCEIFPLETSTILSNKKLINYKLLKPIKTHVKVKLTF